jgi:hypothetical protein
MVAGELSAHQSMSQFSDCRAVQGRKVIPGYRGNWEISEYFEESSMGRDGVLS